MAKATTRIIKDFDPKKLDEIRKRLGGPVTVNVGFPESAGTHPDAGVSVASLAAVHEFGTATIPERSFLRAGVRRNKGDYVRLNRQTMKKVIAGEMTLQQALGLLGEKAKGDVQMEITNGDFAPLQEATVKRKGSSKPLIDSGQMRQSVAWEYGDD